MEIDTDDTEKMYEIGYYYQYEEINYDLMKKHYLIAIKNGWSKAMYNLGYYYYTIEKNYNLMINYYLMAVKKGNTDAMSGLGNYYEMNHFHYINDSYQIIYYNYTLMKKYYLLYYKYKSYDYVINRIYISYKITKYNNL